MNLLVPLIVPWTLFCMSKGTGLGLLGTPQAHEMPGTGVGIGRETGPTLGRMGQPRRGPLDETTLGMTLVATVAESPATWFVTAHTVRQHARIRGETPEAGGGNQI